MQLMAISACAFIQLQLSLKTSMLGRSKELKRFSGGFVRNAFSVEILDFTVFLVRGSP